MWVWTYKHIDEPLIKARSRLFIDTLCVTANVSVTASFLLFVCAAIDAPVGDYDPTTDWASRYRGMRIATLVLYFVQVLAQACFMATVIARQHMLYQIFQECSTADATRMKRDFFMPHLRMLHALG